MALIKCSECSNEVSDKATACPKCGAPIEKPIAQPNIQQPPMGPPPIYHQAPPVKKKSPLRIIIPIVILGIVLIAALIIVNNPNAFPGIKVELNTPKPTVVTSRADAAKSGLLKLKETVYATIMNQGGSGSVLVTFHVYQDGNDFERSKSIYVSENGTKDLDETFDEVTVLGGQITYNVEVRAE